MRIGVFDSGIGGLTVLKELIHDKPNNEYIYFGDTLNLPYGDKTKDQLFSLTTRIIDFFKQKRVELIIVACGTVSATVFKELKQYSSIPIINVIDPTVTFLKKNNYKNVALIATKATIDSKNFENKLLNVGLNVSVQECPKFVPLIESNKIDSKEMNDAINEYLINLKNDEAIILGCTHYPLIEKQIDSYFKHKLKIINMGKLITSLISNNGVSNVELYFSKITPQLIDNTNNILNYDYIKEEIKI